MPNREFASKIQARFLSRQVLTGAQADAPLGPAVDTLDHDQGISFYIMAEAFTSGQLDFSVEEADDAAFSVNQRVLPADHYVEQPTLPVSLSAAQTPAVSNATRIGIFATRKFVRLRMVAAAFNGTVVAFVGMKPDIAPSGSLSNQG